MRALLIDDDQFYLTMLRNILLTIDKSATVDCITNPLDAVDQCHAAPPDIISVDYMMPALSGSELIARLRRVPTLRGVPIVMLTGTDSQSVRWKALAAGATDFITKPIEVREAQARFSNLLELRRAHKELLVTSRMASIGHLSAGIAHELNTPLQFIGDNLAYIQTHLPRLTELASLAKAAGTAPPRQDGPADGVDIDILARELPAALDDMRMGLEKVSEIVDAMSRFCHPATSAPVGIDVHALIDSVCTITRGNWERIAGLTLKLGDDLPIITAVEGEVSQVLINLMLNASQAIADAAMPGPGRIEIATRHRDGWVEISVADNGVGIPRENHEKIFDMFFTTRPPGQGTGQGLAVSLAIVLRLGGTISVTSEPGRGACFRIQLPMAEPPTAD